MRRMKCGMLLLVLLCAAAALCGCQASTSVTTRSSALMKGESITLLHVWPEQQELMKRLTTALNESSEDFTLRLLCKDEQEAQAYVRTALTAQSMTDLYAADAHLIEDFIRQGGAQSLKKALSQDLSPRAAAAFAHENTAMAMPLFEEGAVLAVNVDFLKENGQSVPKYQEDLLEILSQLKEKGVFVPLALSSKPDGGELLRLRAVVTDALLLESGCANRDDRDNWQGMVARGASILNEWSRAGYFGDDFFSRSKEDARALFMEQQSPFLFCGTREAAKMIMDGTDFQLQIMAFPGMRDAEHAMGIDSGFAGIALWNQSGAVHALDALQAFAEECALDVQALQSGWIPVRAEPAEEQLMNCPLWQLAKDAQQPAGKNVLPEQRSLQGQLLVEYLTSSMTADAFEMGFGAISADN